MRSIRNRSATIRSRQDSRVSRMLDVRRPGRSGVRRGEVTLVERRHQSIDGEQIAEFARVRHNPTPAGNVFQCSMFGVHAIRLATYPARLLRIGRRGSAGDRGCNIEGTRAKFIHECLQSMRPLGQALRSPGRHVGRRPTNTKADAMTWPRQSRGSSIARLARRNRAGAAPSSIGGRAWK